MKAGAVTYNFEEFTQKYLLVKLTPGVNTMNTLHQIINFCEKVNIFPKNLSLLVSLGILRKNLASY